MLQIVEPDAAPLRAAILACRRHFVGAALFSGLLNLLFLAPTLYMLQVYDRVVPTRGVTTLVLLSVAFLFAMGVLAALDMFRSRLLVRASARLDRLLAGVVLDALLSQPPGRVRTSALMREFDVLRQTLTGPAMLAAFDAPWAPIYILVCFLLNPILGMVALLGVCTLLFLAWLNERGTKAPLQRATESSARAYNSLDQSIANAGVVRALGMRTAMIARHGKERHSALHLQVGSSFTSSRYTSLTKFFRLSIQSMALGAGAYLAVEQKISPGSIFAASLLVGRSLAPIELVVGAWRSIVQARGAYRSVVSMLGDYQGRRRHTQLPAPTGLLELERVALVNDTRDRVFLNGVGFRLEAGESLGVIGQSGAGKSMLMKVIAGAMRASQGEVRFDGSERADWDDDQLARYVGYLPQETALFQGTVRENIARFDDFLDAGAQRIDDAVVKAATASGAHQLITHLPQGYDSPLGPGGTGLSAGQAQRIAMARALYGDPRVVILDEPNAHLDAEGEAILFRTMQELKAAGVTVIVVAHRTGILSNVDKLLVMRDGRVEMMGPREEIIQRMNPAPPPTVPRRPAGGTPPQVAESGAEAIEA